ncbi:MAG TPA: VOC family protein [Thermoplasmata archaeon]|nr:VOC family protein [Thermoplasmata archaeon]
MGLVYVGLRVTDLARSLRFYTEGLGLVAEPPGTMSHGGTLVGLKDPGTGAQLELNYYPPGHPHATPYVPGEGLDHLGFEVADARATVERLRALGARVAVEPWLERERFWIGYVEDPDGNWIEIQSVVAGTESGPSGPSGPS